MVSVMVNIDDMATTVLAGLLQRGFRRVWRMSSLPRSLVRPLRSSLER